MVYVQTTHDISCTIEGDKIVQDGDNVIVYLVNNGKSEPSITAILDIGAIQFIYITHSRKRET